MNKKIAGIIIILVIFFSSLGFYIVLYKHNDKEKPTFDSSKLHIDVQNVTFIELYHVPDLPSPGDEIIIYLKVGADVTVTYEGEKIEYPYRLDPHIDFNSFFSGGSGCGGMDVIDNTTFKTTMGPFSDGSVINYIIYMLLPNGSIIESDEKIITIGYNKSKYNETILRINNIYSEPNNLIKIEDFKIYVDIEHQNQIENIGLSYRVLSRNRLHAGGGGGEMIKVNNTLYVGNVYLSEFSEENKVKIGYWVFVEDVNGYRALSTANYIYISE